MKYRLLRPIAALFGLGLILQGPITVWAQDAKPVTAAKSEAALNDLYAQQWVRASSEGLISGRVTELVNDATSPLGKLKVALAQNGKSIYVVEADDNGSFAFSGVKPGSYSLVARSDTALAAFALNVLEGEENKHLPTNIEVHAVRPTGEKMREILRAQIVPPYLTRIDTNTKPLVDLIGAERTFAKSHMVLTDSQGKFVGQIAKSGVAVGQVNMKDMTVFITRDGEEVARTVVDANGAFSVSGLKPGNYGMVTAGNQGFAAVSFQLADAKLAKLQSDSGRFVSVIGGDVCCPAMHVEVINPCDVVVCEKPIVRTEIIETVSPVSEVVVDECGVAPSCGCGAGGGFAGGYGGGGGGGGFGGGGLIGLAGLGAIAAAIATQEDDDGFVFVPPPVVSGIAP